MSSNTRHPSGDQFPCASLAEALPQLRRPPTPAAVRFKIQNAVDEAAQVAAYVDARLVFDRLDHVCGAHWSPRFRELPAALIPPPCDRDGQPLARPPLYVRCRLTVFGVGREDVGEGEDPKAAFSDAIKRAAVHFGVGRALYALEAPWLREGEGDGELRRNRKGRLVIDQRTEGWLRGQYARWLERKGRAQFGEPLAHGDDPGAPGFDAETAGVPGAEEWPIEIDQGQGSAAEARPAAGPGPAPARPDAAASEDGPMTELGAASTTADHSAGVEAQAGEVTTSQPPNVTGRLRAVTDGTPGEPPATALDRQQIAHWQQVGRYSDESVQRLAGLLFGERIVERLSHRQVFQLALMLEFAIRGRVAQGTLAGALTRLEKRDDRGEAAEALRGWLVQKANPREPLGKRKAA